MQKFYSSFSTIVCVFFNTADSHGCNDGENGCIADRVHGFDITRHAHSSRKDGSVFPLVGGVSRRVFSVKTLRELQYSH